MRKRILIVDDEIESLRFIQDVLEEYGYSVISLDSPESALKLVKQSFFDLVLLDVNMPEMNGLELFKEIKTVSPLSTVIMMTAGAPESMLKEAVNEGSFAVVYKPFKLDKLVTLIEKALKRTTVLVVDKFFTEREMLKTLLEQKGFKCVSVDTGEQAISLFKMGKPDIVFLDVSVPEPNGFLLLEKIKKIEPESDIIVMSSNISNENLEKALKMGAFTCMYKPVNIDNLIDVIDNIKRKEQAKAEHYSVLLAEDDEDLRSTFAELLGSSDYLVTPAATGQQAIDESRKKYFDAVVMDLKLPDMSGIDAIKKIKEASPDIVVIIMTGHESLDAAIEAIKEKVYDFLVKPVAPATLLVSLKKGLGVSKKER